MKKIYFLFLLSCFSYAAFAQGTVVIYATGATGSFITGTATSFGGRLDGPIVSTSGFATSRGYGVFDLSALPAAGITITSCDIGFNVSNYGGTGTPSGWETYGYAGDLSTVTAAATLYADMVAGSLLTTASYGTAAGDQVLPSTAATNTFIQGQIGNKVSICWTGGASRAYTITDETGTATLTSGATGHAPYLQINYTCTGVTGVAASAAPSPACAGNTVTLTSVGIGTSTYLWMGPGGYTSTLQNPSFASTPASDGVYTLTAYNSGGCGTTVTTTLSISATPTATVTASGSTVFCPGGNVVLTGPADISGPGYTYQWSESGTPIGGATNQSYTDTTGGSYTVLVTGSNGCSAVSTPSVTAVLPASPSLLPGATADLCIGGDVTLGVETGGVTSGISYQWMIDSAAITGATAATYTANTGGTYFVIVSTSGCSDTSMSAVVTVYPLPHPVISFSSSTGLLSTSSSYGTYQWYLNTVAIPGATSYTFYPSNVGSYQVIVADPHGCGGMSAAYVLEKLAVDQVAATDVSIYPNPAANELHIVSAAKLHAVISGIEGKKLIDQPAVESIDISSLPQGLYLITLYNDAGDRVAIQKFARK